MIGIDRSALERQTRVTFAPFAFSVIFNPAADGGLMQEESSQEEPRMRPQGEEERRFTVVRRGYDRAEVDGYVREMWDRAVQLQENRPPTPAADLSRRLTHILEIANEEADDLRADARRAATRSSLMPRLGRRR